VCFIINDLFFLLILQETGCDVFFNIPNHPNPVKYTYQLVNVPVKVMMFGPGQLVKVSCDWMQHFNTYLQQGWRLAEIFWDQGKRSHGGLTIYWYFICWEYWYFICWVNILLAATYIRDL